MRKGRKMKILENGIAFHTRLHVQRLKLAIKTEQVGSKGNRDGF